jgi:Protein of unknown function (DUF1176)
MRNALALGLMLAASVPSAAAVPAPGLIQTISDWSVGCDNGRTCKALGLMPPSLPDRKATISIERGPEPLAVPTIRIAIEDLVVENRLPAAFVIDGIRKLGLATTIDDSDAAIIIPGNSALRFIRQLSRGRNLELVDATGKSLAVMSLSGLNAALHAMDQQQHRMRTVTALIHPGKRAANIVPKPPPLPIIRIPAAAKVPPYQLDAVAEARLLNDLRCDGKPLRGASQAQYPLDDRHSFFWQSWHCGKGEPNLLSRAIIVSSEGALSAPRFDIRLGPGEGGNPVLRNAEWDQDKRLLITNNPGRSMAACNMTQSFVWDGSRFRLVEQAETRECRGNYSYIRTWRAQAVVGSAPAVTANDHRVTR